MRRIVVHIDRLVLRNVDAGDAGAVSAALTAELQARLGGDEAIAALRSWHGSPSVRAGRARVGDAAEPAAVGRAAARQILRGTGR
jgi:hypothetical protein